MNLQNILNESYWTIIIVKLMFSFSRDLKVLIFFSQYTLITASSLLNTNKFIYLHLVSWRENPSEPERISSRKFLLHLCLPLGWYRCTVYRHNSTKKQTDNFKIKSIRMSNILEVIATELNVFYWIAAPWLKFRLWLELLEIWSLLKSNQWQTFNKLK